MLIVVVCSGLSRGTSLSILWSLLSRLGGRCHSGTYLFRTTHLCRRADEFGSFLWEKFITWYNYRGVEDLTPAHLGLFEGTPVSWLFHLVLCVTANVHAHHRSSTTSSLVMFAMANATTSAVIQNG